MNGHYILKINNRCNMNCLFCADPERIRKLPDQEFNKIIRNLKENRKKTSSLIITGGEPTIYKKLFSALKFSKKICRYDNICIVSNGIRLANEKYLDKLIESGVNSFQISYFALDKKKHNALSRTKETFEYVKKGIQNIVKRNKIIRINVVINKFNYIDLPKIVEELINLKVNKITLSFMNPAGESESKGKSTLAVEYSKIIHFIDASFDKAKKMRFLELYIENFPICISRNHMDKNTDLTKPIENKKYYIKDKIKTKKCERCVYKKECNGTWNKYIEQFGDSELKPIIFKPILVKREKKFIDLEKEDNLFLGHIFELIGLEIGIKKAAILYVYKKELPYYKKKLSEMGYIHATSNFSLITKDEKTKIINGDKGEISLYISKEEKTIDQLKYLDYYHQSKKNTPEGKSHKEIFMEISKILGYPKCCSNFLWETHKYKEYEKTFDLTEKEYEDETIYKLLAAEKSNKISYLINNFRINQPKLISFFVCNYNCEKAREIAKKILDYTSYKYPDKYTELVNALKTPFIFFSAYRIINIKNPIKKDNKIRYSGCFVPNSRLNIIKKWKKEEFIKKSHMFSEGDSFRIDYSRILIYKNKNLIHLIKKKHKYDGIYIKPV